MQISKAIMNAYSAVFSEDTDAVEELRTKRISSALNEVFNYSGLHKGEQEKDKLKRLGMESAARGEVKELADYFKDIDTSIDFKLSSWKVIFIVYKRMIDAQSKKEENPVSSTKASSDINNIITQKEKENMSETNKMTTIEDINDMEKSIGSRQTEMKTSTDNLPKDDMYQAAVSAAQQKIKEDKAARRAFTEGSKFLNVVLGKEKAEKIAVDGLKAKGKIVDAKAQLANFQKKTGYKYNPETQEVTFSSIPSTKNDYDAAVAMLDVLQKAVDDPDMELQAYFAEKAIPTIKGYKFLEPSGGAPKAYKSEALLDIAMNKSIGIIPGPTADTQLQAKKATKKANSKKKKKGSGKKTSTKTQKYSGLASLSLVNRKETCEQFGVYHLEITPETKIDTGYKSEMAVKYIRPIKDDEDEPTTGVYRIPLMINQYVLKVTDEELKNVFGDGTRTNVATAISLEDTEKLSKLLDDMAIVCAEVYTKNPTKADKGIFGEIREEVAKKSEAEDKAQSEGVEE